MSVSTMRRLTVLAPRSEEERLLSELLRLGCVEITPVEEDGDGEGPALTRFRSEEDRLALEASLTDIETAQTVLNRYTGRKKGLLSGLSDGRHKTDLTAFAASPAYAAAKETVRLTVETVAEQTRLKAETAAIDAKIDALTPWEGYDVPLDVNGTRSTSVLLGSLSVSVNADTLVKELYDVGGAVETVGEDKATRYVAVFCHRSDAEAVSTLLASYGFLPANLKGFTGEAHGEKLDLIRQKKKKHEEFVNTEMRLRKLSDQLTNVEILYDVEATSLAATREEAKLLATASCFWLEGWVPSEKEEKLKKKLDGMDAAYELRDPAEGEEAPVLLRNNSVAKNFEWVLGMYAYPKYGTFDPTFVMAIFYIVIFGLMFADAGYGLILMLAGFLGAKLLHPKESMKRFLLMFGYCGIASTVFGVLFGAYFGDFPLAFMRSILGMSEADLPNLSFFSPTTAANLAVLFDPLQNPMGFLILSLGLGGVHLVAGMLVKFILLCRDGHPLDAVFDIGFYWVLFAGVGLIFVNKNVGLITMGVGALAIVLTHGREAKNPFMKLIKGLLGLYDLVNYVADLLSYSRILALGLASAVIGQVVNIVATMIGPNAIGFIVMVLVFIVGHLLNLAINALGTFVHTSRLQYIEFFGKFYEDGGVPFRPASVSEKYTEDTAENDSENL